MRGFVTDAKTRGRFVGELTMALNGDEFVRRRHLGGLYVGVELVQRFAADPARAAVLEE